MSHKYCYVTSFIRDRCHCQSKQSLPCVSQVGGDLQLVAIYVLNGAVPSNVKRMSLIFKISKINLEYVAISITEIPQCLQRGHRGFLAFQTYDVTKFSSEKVLHLVSHRLYLLAK